MHSDPSWRATGTPLCEQGGGSGGGGVQNRSPFKAGLAQKVLQKKSERENDRGHWMSISKVDKSPPDTLKDETSRRCEKSERSDTIQLADWGFQAPAKHATKTLASTESPFDVKDPALRGFC